MNKAVKFLLREKLLEIRESLPFNAEARPAKQLIDDLIILVKRDL